MLAQLFESDPDELPRYALDWLSSLGTHKYSGRALKKMLDTVP